MTEHRHLRGYTPGYQGPYPHPYPPYTHTHDVGMGIFHGSVRVQSWVPWVWVFPWVSEGTDLVVGIQAFKECTT